MSELDNLHVYLSSLVTVLSVMIFVAFFLHKREKGTKSFICLTYFIHYGNVIFLLVWFFLGDRFLNQLNLLFFLMIISAFFSSGLHDLKKILKSSDTKKQ